MRIAVTGGSGLLGTPLIADLLARGHSVLSLDRRAPEIRQCPSVAVDLTDRKRVARVLRDIDIVIHTGEIPSVGLGPTPGHVLATNVQIFSNVVEIAAAQKVRRIFYTSSCQVYGCFGEQAIAPDCLPFDETHPLRPQNAYGLSKATNESHAALIARASGVPFTIFRYPFILAEMDRCWNYIFSRRELDTPKGLRDGLSAYIHVTDAVSAFQLAIDADRPGLEFYHLVAEDIVQDMPLAELLQRYRPNFPRLPADWPPMGSPLITSKAKQNLGWTPKWSLHREGLERLAKGPQKRIFSPPRATFWSKLRRFR